MKLKSPWPIHITTIAEIEKLTGINFLAIMDATQRTKVEKFKATSLWPKE